MEIVAVRDPTPLGSNVISKVAVPPDAATVVAGWVVTVKSAAFVPLTLTALLPKVSRPSPLLVMVKLWASEPESSL